MLYELFDAWADKKRLIVNIGSETTCGIKKKPHNYSAYKAALDKASEQLSHLNAPCKVMNVRFGWLGTDRVIRDYNPEEFITLGDAYTMLMQQIEWASKYRITESLIRP
jgi:NAD(P)-dependent dehydrogenase (short-subunit alcohol dehydrogenase family)